ncbi:hypothetical protein CBR_g4128 [Chara braunii]|uniref:Pectate lyase superfamily protein domain-containing protein n=1 Tax=Chara braunii TaxID=69332 RepID=A0A388KH86_CHABU|nr:hypothetical protein CBR_g4128 [Chara braunii]|eukprot:GBG69434.1 hypothetical protein CBR_g4128 [Chara braunii]
MTQGDGVPATSLSLILPTENLVEQEKGEGEVGKAAADDEEAGVPRRGGGGGGGGGGGEAKESDPLLSLSPSSLELESGSHRGFLSVYIDSLTSDYGLTRVVSGLRRISNHVHWETIGLIILGLILLVSFAILYQRGGGMSPTQNNDDEGWWGPLCDDCFADDSELEEEVGSGGDGGGGGGGGGEEGDVADIRSVVHWKPDLTKGMDVFEWVTHPPPRLPRRRHVFTLSDFGGVGDGLTGNTQAFELAMEAIKKVSKYGGAELHVEAGDWLTGPISLTSHMTLYVEAGARILGSKDISHYPLVDPWPSYGSGRNSPGPRHLGLIYGDDVVDVVLTGEGTIDGQGNWVWKLVEEKKFNYTPGCMIEFMWSKRIVISGLKLVNSAFWNVHLLYCDQVHIHGLEIKAPLGSHNTDGIDIDSSKKVLVEDCDISTGDDAICIKSGWDQYGKKMGIPAENICIRSIVVGLSHGVSIGSEISGGVRKVRIDGIRFNGSERAFRVKTTAGRGAYVHDITVKNIYISGGLRDAIEFFSDYRSGSFTHPDDGYDPTAYTDIQDIVIKRFVGVDCDGAGVFEGTANSSINAIHLKDVFFHNWKKSSPYTCYNVTGTQRNVSPPAPLNCFHVS